MFVSGSYPKNFARGFSLVVSGLGLEVAVFICTGRYSISVGKDA